MYNGRPYRLDSDEYRLIKAFDDKLKAEGILEPYRSEWMMWHKELRLIGSADMIFKYCDGRRDENGVMWVEIYDWKRSKKIEYSNRFAKGCTELTKDEDDCNFIHYTYQMEVYAIMLEANYNVRVAGANLVILHPQQDEPLIIPIPIVKERLERIIAFRKKQLLKLTA